MLPMKVPAGRARPDRVLAKDRCRQKQERRQDERTDGASPADERPAGRCCSAEVADRASPERRHLGFCLLQPEAHVYLAEHRRGGGEVLSGLLALARASVQLAEVEMAVGT